MDASGMMTGILAWLRQAGSNFVSALPGLSNLAVLLAFLWFAIGATCEIVNRNQDYGRVSAYEKSLLACRISATDKDCPKADDADQARKNLDSLISVASTQIRRYNSLNSLGAPDRCHVAAVIASEITYFWEDCENVLRSRAGQTDVEFHKPENKTLIASILAPSAFTYSGWPFGFDEKPKEPLYFLLVLASAAIGSLIAGLRTAGFSTHRDLALGIGAGFAIYLLLRTGNFVFFTGSSATDILNPFTAATVGLMVGLFNERAFGLIGSAMPSGLSPAAQTANKAQTDAVAAAATAHTVAATAVAAAPPGTAQHAALQNVAIATLDAKTKAETAAKAQGEALKTG